MRQYISPGEKEGKGGIGTEDDPRSPGFTLRTQSLLSIAFGLALGITFMIFFFIFQYVNPPRGTLTNFASQLHLSWWLSFLYGFIGGTVMAAIYNMLVVHRLNLFGLESHSD